MPRYSDPDDFADGGVEITIDDRDITEYLYSDQCDLDGGYRQYFDRKTLLMIHEQFAHVDPRFEQSDIRLLPVSRRIKPGVGSILMGLQASAQRLLKRIIKVTDITVNNGMRFYNFDVLWPESSEGFGGFFNEDSLFEVVEGQLGVHDPEIFFHYTYKGDGEYLDRPNRPKSKYERLYELARDLEVLVQAWSVVHNPDLEGCWSADPFYFYWEQNFQYMPQHEDWPHRRMLRVLQEVSQVGYISYEIDQIYDAGRFTIDAWRRDLVTPLLEQIQQEVLTALLRDESLADKLFGGGSGSFNRRMKVIFERFYGPKTLVHVETPEPDEADMPEPALGFKTRQKLKLLVNLINCPAAAGPERQAAMNAYERLSGKPYVESRGQIHTI